MREITVKANGLEFACLEEGDGPLVLLLHGFPDDARTWSHQMPALAAAGYRAIAPWLRGYPPTEIPADGFYDTATLAADAIALVETLGAPAFVVGHDWGALMTYSLAAARPDLLRRAVTMAMPHPGVFARFLASYEQLRRSFYIWFFQLSFLPEAAVSLDNFAFVEKIWADWSPGHADPEQIANVKETLARPGALEATIGYYRAMFDPGRSDPSLGPLRSRITGDITVPLLSLHGENDGCLGAEMTAGAEEFFNTEYNWKMLAAGHFLHRELPEQITTLILSFLEEA